MDKTRFSWNGLICDGNNFRGEATSFIGGFMTKFENDVINLAREVEGLGVLIVGADSSFKDYVSMVFSFHGSTEVGYSDVSYPVRILDGEKSCSHTERHNAVMNMMNDGVKNVVMVYVQKNADTPSMNPPTLDGLAGIITVTDEE